jgi:hypothetical protein
MWPQAGGREPVSLLQKSPGFQAGATEIFLLLFGFQQKFRYIFNLEDKC